MISSPVLEVESCLGLSIDSNDELICAVTLFNKTEMIVLKSFRLHISDLVVHQNSIIFCKVCVDMIFIHRIINSH